MLCARHGAKGWGYKDDQNRQGSILENTEPIDLMHWENSDRINDKSRLQEKTLLLQCAKFHF